MQKKLSCIVFIILAFFILTLPFPAGAVVDWTNRTETDLGPGPAGAWDDDQIGLPNVIKDGSTYKMWYTGKSSAGPSQIGYATSSDGVTWTKYPANPIITPADVGTWEGQPVRNVSGCAVIKNGSLYEMWYTAGTVTVGHNGQIGYATSLDGITWVHHGPPVLLRGPSPAGDWDGGDVTNPTVIKDGGTYKMWYVGHGAALVGIGYATSPDGITWTKYNNSATSIPYASSDPVIKLGPVRSWNYQNLGSPAVIKEDAKYHLWFLGGGSTDDLERIGYAYSGDGINWNTYTGNPLLHPGAPGAFDGGGVREPVVIKDGTTYRMWYHGLGTGAIGTPTGKINYAESHAYQGNTLSYSKINVMARYELTRSGISFNIQGRFPSPLDITQCTVSGPNGFYAIVGDGQIYNDNERQYFNQFVVMTGGMSSAYSGTYTVTMKAGNGLTATKSIDVAVSPIVVPTDPQWDRYVGTASGMNVYAGTTNPTLKWKPYPGDNYYYRIQVQDWRTAASWYKSDWALGSSKGGDGYLSVTIPSGVLKANTPYKWKVQVADINPTLNNFNGYNRADSANYNFYTGTKGTGNFLSFVLFDRTQSYNEGGTTTMGAGVVNLAPWDFAPLNPNRFRVENETNATYYTFAPGNDAFTTDHAPFMYYKSLNSPPITNTSSLGYKFFVSDGSSSSTLYAQYLNPTIQKPQLTREQMTPRDNAYLQTLEPALAWKSDGTDYRYQVGIIDWNNLRQVYRSNILPGLPAGQDMSIMVPSGILQASSPYRWFVDIFDSGRYNRMRSEILAFMTPAENFAPNAAPSGGGTYQVKSSVLLGGQVSDVDGDQLSYQWLEGATVLFSGTIQTTPGGTAVYLPYDAINTLAVGTHTLTLQVSDGVNPPVSSSVIVEIIDTIAPILSPAPDKTILWPANHKMVPITIYANASDNSGGPVSLSASIASNEPQDGLGDGDMPQDWTAPVINNGIITLQLRAERSGKGNGRLYTVTIVAKDQSGNSSTATVTISVPHDMGKGK